MGCLHKVFATEIDVELFAEAERTPRGLRRGQARRPSARALRLPIERAFPDVDDCVNRRFFDWPEAAPGAVRAFDLRDRL